MYEPMRATLQAIHDEFSRASQMYKPIYHETLHCTSIDEPHVMTNEAWKRFMDAHSVGARAWQEWHGPYGPEPYVVVGRFHGSEEGFDEYKQLASSCYAALCELDLQIPEEGPDWKQLINLIEMMACTHPTPLLRVNLGLWNFTPPTSSPEDVDTAIDNAMHKWDEEGNFLSHPRVAALQNNLFTSTMAAIRMILDPSSTLLVGPEIRNVSGFAIPTIPAPSAPQHNSDEPVYSRRGNSHNDAKPPANCFRKDGPVWRVSFSKDGDAVEVFPEMDGFSYYCELLKSPDHGLECRELDFRLGRPVADYDDDDNEKGEEYTFAPRVDLKVVRQQLSAYQKELDSTEKGTARYREIQDSISALQAQNSKDVNKFGKSRRLGSPPTSERNRNRIHQSLLRCRTNIAKKMPHLSNFLTVSTKWDGTKVAYVPPSHIDWEF